MVMMCPVRALFSLSMMQPASWTYRRRRTGDQHEALLEVGAGHDVVGDVVVGGIRQREGDDANDGTQRPALAEHVHTEAPRARHGEGEVVVMVVASMKICSLWPDSS